MSEKRQKRLRIHNNAQQDRTPAGQTWLVSKTEYALRKTLAISLSVCLGICGIGIVLLVLGLPYSSYLDARFVAEHGSNAMWALDEPPGFVVALSLCMVFVPILAVIALPLWLGSRKSWKTVRALRPINAANTGDLPAVETLVRASDLPPSRQPAELLRAAGPGQQTPAAELLRAGIKGADHQDPLCR